MSGVWREIWTSLQTIVPVVASAVAFSLAILGSLWDPGIKLQIGLIWFVVIGFVVITAVGTAINWLWTPVEQHMAILPGRCLFTLQLRKSGRRKVHSR